MRTAHHANLASGAWQSLSLAAQLANIGAEFSRMAHQQAEGDAEGQKLSAERLFELTDLTLADPRWEKRTPELSRLREVMSDAFLGSNIYGTSPETLEDYFLPFALVAQKHT